MKLYHLLLLSVLFFASCSAQDNISKAKNSDEPAKLVLPSSVKIPEKIEPVEKSEEDWKEALSEEEFYVLREKGTERPFTGDLWDNKKEGIYTCSGCQLPLFESTTKFKSGTGWPSFYQPIEEKCVAEEKDFGHGMVRVEVLCGRCKGHLGHVFNDGPAPTNLRYCINSVSMDFVEINP